MSLPNDSVCDAAQNWDRAIWQLNLIKPSNLPLQRISQLPQSSLPPPVSPAARHDFRRHQLSRGHRQRRLILWACEGAARQRERLRDEMSASDCWYVGAARRKTYATHLKISSADERLLVRVDKTLKDQVETVSLSWPHRLGHR